MGRRVLVATAHEGEVGELRRILAAAGWEAVTCAQSNLEAPPFGFEGATLREQAVGRASTYADRAGLPAIAVASAFNVYANGQRPGLETHRYGGEGASDADHRAKLLRDMKRVPTGQRIALFQVAIAVAAPGGAPKVCNSTLECEVAVDERGEGGYLFDPITQLNNKKTLAEMDDDERDRSSHRGMAMKQVVKHLETLAAASA